MICYLLFSRTDDFELMAYEVFPFLDPRLDKRQLKMRFKKLKHGLILRERRGQ